MNDLDRADNRQGRNMRIAAFLLAIFIIAVSVVGIVSTEYATTLRRLYFATPGRFYAAGAVRVAMGLVLILAASSSRWPQTLRAMGAVMCLQALAANLFGIERARAIMEWEAMQGTALLRAGAVVALASGVLVAFAVTKRQPMRRSGNIPRISE
jgi:peptidoglycan/LPS O-acetylase OafA/YrhL